MLSSGRSSARREGTSRLPESLCGERSRQECERGEALSVEVLTRSVDNARARLEMRRQGFDFATKWWGKLLRRAHLLQGETIGQLQKSWDVLRTVAFIEQHVKKGMPILDMGAHTSEVLLCLHKMGFTDLSGIDLDPAVTRMPHNGSIKYLTGDFMATPFPSETFGAISAISVIEHGFSGAKLFQEISRILKSGGYFIGSTDYWPEKINTSGIQVYGVDWKIFSKDELQGLVEQAGKYGLVPVGPLNFDAGQATIHWKERNYTFAWFAFQKVGRGEGA